MVRFLENFQEKAFFPIERAGWFPLWFSIEWPGKNGFPYGGYQINDKKEREPYNRQA
jgi:hypothetical protein